MGDETFGMSSMWPLTPRRAGSWALPRKRHHSWIICLSTTVFTSFSLFSRSLASSYTSSCSADGDKPSLVTETVTSILKNSFQTKARGYSLTATSSALGNSAFKLVIARPQPACLCTGDTGRLIKYPSDVSGEVASWGFTFILFQWLQVKTGQLTSQALFLLTAVMAGTACNLKFKLCLSSRASSP